MGNQVVAITGAAGNLGSILAEGLLSEDVELHLLWHKKPLPETLLSSEKVKPFQVDLRDAKGLEASLKGVDTVIHFAGILFMGNPEKFLPTTNVQYFANLLQAAKLAGVKKVVLFSFPHVEGDTTPEHPDRTVGWNTQFCTCEDSFGGGETVDGRDRIGEGNLTLRNGLWERDLDD